MGSNLGDGPRNLDAAIAMLQTEVGEVLFTSAYLESEPWGFESDHPFTNAVTVVRTELSPLEVLDATQGIERKMGRRHKRQHRDEVYTDRIIDLDILFYDDLHLDTERLTLPHPLIEERDFVRLPLAECREAMARQQRKPTVTEA